MNTSTSPVKSDTSDQSETSETSVRTAAVGLLSLIALFAASSTAWAQPTTCRWSGNAAPDNVWSNPLNWDMCRGGIPLNGDSVEFPNSSKQGTNVNDIPNTRLSTIGGIGLAGQPGDGTPQNPFSHWDIKGNGLVISGRGIVGQSLLTSVSVNDTMEIPITLGADIMIQNTPISPGDSSTRLQIGDIHLNGHSVTFALDFPVTVAGSISGAGGATGAVKLTTATVSQTESTALTLNDNSFTGTTDIIHGTLIAKTNTALGSSASPVLDHTTVETAAILQLADGVTMNEPIVLVGGNIDVPSGTATYAGPISIPPPPSQPGSIGGTLEAAGIFRVTGQIVAADGDVLFVLGPGSFFVTNPGNVFPTLNILSGAFIVGAQGAMPQAQLNVLANVSGATFDLGTFDATIQSLSGGPAATIQLGGQKLTINQSVDGNYAGVITGAGGSIVKKGTAKLTLSGTAVNTYTGATTVQTGTLELAKSIGSTSVPGPVAITGGTLLFSADNQSSAAAAYTVTAPGTMVLADHREAIGSLAGNGPVTIGTGMLTIGRNNTSTRYDGAFAGTLATGGNPDPSVYVRIDKVGTGTLTLTADSVLSDKLVVDAGAVLFDGRLKTSGPIVNAGGLLGGNGTIFDDNGITPLVSITQVNGGTLSPGHSPGTIHGDALQFSSGGRLAIELNGLTPGTGYDQVILNNTLTFIDATATLVVTRGFPVPKNSTFTIVKLPAGARASGTFAGLPEGAQLELDGQKFSITYAGGGGGDIVLTALEGPPPISYFLSEGATGNFFHEDVLIANPNTDPAPVTLTFSREDGSQVQATRSLPPQSHITVQVNSIPGLEAVSGVAAQVTSTTGLPLVVERSMFWDATSYAGSTGSSVDKPAQDWFFAEGSQGFFFTFLLVNNPNPTPTNVTFTFFLESGATVTKTIPIGATTRHTLYAGDVPELVNQSFGTAVHATQPIMVERSMYFGTRPDGRVWCGGTESAGVTATSTHWFLAEGATGGFFNTYVLLSNPNDTAANVTVQYLLPNGDTITSPKTLPPHARLTTNIGADEQDVRLKNTAVSTVVNSDQPIIAERSMYWPGAIVPFGEGHNSFGVVDPGLKWGLSEGRTGTPLNFHTYILLANPQTTAANVTVTFLRDTGAPVVKTFTVAATSRFNIDSATITELHDESFGAVIESTNNVPIIVERSMYWDSNGFSFSGGTNATGIRLP